MPLTAVPQRTALSHAFGGLAAGLVGTAKYYLWLAGRRGSTAFRIGAIALEVLLGFLTFTGSLMAVGKLQEVLPTRPITYRGPERRQPLAAGVAVAAGIGALPDRRPGAVVALPRRDRAVARSSACC